MKPFKFVSIRHHLSLVVYLEIDIKNGDAVVELTNLWQTLTNVFYFMVKVKPEM